MTKNIATVDGRSGGGWIRQFRTLMELPCRPPQYCYPGRVEKRDLLKHCNKRYTRLLKYLFHFYHEFIVTEKLLRINMLRILII